MYELVQLGGKPINTLQERRYSITKTITLAELAMYHHQTLCLPPESTLLQVIANQQLDSFPDLTYGSISKHLPPSTASDKGHMVRMRKNLQSTRENRKEILDARLAVNDMNPLHQICTAIDNEVFCFTALADANEDTIYSDLTGRFRVRSYTGNQYIFIA